MSDDRLELLGVSVTLMGLERAWEKSLKARFSRPPDLFSGGSVAVHSRAVLRQYGTDTSLLLAASLALSAKLSLPPPAASARSCVSTRSLSTLRLQIKRSSLLYKHTSSIGLSLTTSTGLTSCDSSNTGSRINTVGASFSRRRASQSRQ